MLTTWQTMQSRLSLDAADQSAVENLIAVASRRADQYVGRHLSARAHTYVLSGTGGRRLLIPDRPINSVTTVAIDRARLFAPESEITDYFIEKDSGFLLRDARWPSGESIIQVVGNFGFTEIPADLAESAIQLVAYWLDSPSIAYTTPQSPAEGGGYQANYVGVMDLPYQVRSIWDTYREYL